MLNRYTKGGDKHLQDLGHENAKKLSVTFVNVITEVTFPKSISNISNKIFRNKILSKKPK